MKKQRHRYTHHNKCQTTNQSTTSTTTTKQPEQQQQQATNQPNNQPKPNQTEIQQICGYIYHAQTVCHLLLSHFS